MRSLRHKRQIREHVCLVSFAPRINDRCQVFEEARRAGTEREKKSERGGREENRVRRRVGFHPPFSLSLSPDENLFCETQNLHKSRGGESYKARRRKKLWGKTYNC